MTLAAEPEMTLFLSFSRPFGLTPARDISLYVWQSWQSSRWRIWDC